MTTKLSLLELKKLVKGILQEEMKINNIYEYDKLIQNYEGKIKELQDYGLNIQEVYFHKFPIINIPYGSEGDIEVEIEYDKIKGILYGMEWEESSNPLENIMIEKVLEVFENDLEVIHEYIKEKEKKEYFNEPDQY